MKRHLVTIFWFTLMAARQAAPIAWQAVRSVAGDTDVATNLSLMPEDLMFGLSPKEPMVLGRLPCAKPGRELLLGRAGAFQ